MAKRKTAAAMAALVALGMLSAFPSAAMAATSSSSGTASSQSSDSSMKKALEMVKSRIKIPDSYSDFEYTAEERNSMQCYHFTWAMPNDKYRNYGQYSVYVQGSMITRYSTPLRTNYGMSLTNIPAASFETKAKEFIEKINPSMKGQLKLRNDVDLSIYNGSVTVRFFRNKNGIEFCDNYVTVEMNKQTGDVISYSCSWMQNAELASPDKALTQEQIKEIYAKETVLKPWYRIKTEYINDKPKYTAYIVYVPTSSSPVYDAFTGKHTTMYSDMEKYQMTDIYEDAVESVDEEAGVGIEGDGGILTEAEINAVNELKNMLTKEKFVKLLIDDPYIKVTDKFMVTRYNINKNDAAECGYMIDASLKLHTDKDYMVYNVSADAKTGKIYSFNSDIQFTEKAIDPVKDSKTASAAAKYYYGDIFDHYKPSPDNTAPAVVTKDSKESSRTYRFYRYENNIQVDNNIIYVTVNSDGIVTSIRKVHTYGVNFGDGKVISPDDAMQSLFKQKDMTLVYRGFTDLKSKAHTYLQYSYENYIINAKTGKLGDYFGNPIKTNETVPSLCPFTDINDSPYKNEIIALYNNGFRFYNESKLQPGKYMTSEELKAFMDVQYSYMPYAAAYYAVKTADNTVTKSTAKRSDFAYRLISRQSYEQTAKLSGIFKSPFKDVPETHDRVGYIAIAKALGYINGGKDGKFYPDAALTREYALHCMYLYLTHLPEDQSYDVVEEEEIMVEAEIV